jgi:hypothetical protein
MALDDIVLSLEDLRNVYATERKDLIARHPIWQADIDARLVIFSKCANVIHSAFLFLLLQRHELSLRSFWTKNFDNVPSDNDLKTHLRECEMFIKTGLFHFIFASLESSMRLFVRAIDPMACNDGAAQFKSIYAWLLIRLGNRSHEPLFDLLRLIRNTIHNNGVYVSPRARNETIAYDGVSYEFEHRKHIDFITWEFVLKRYEDLARTLVQVVEAHELTAISYIEDPSA